MIYRYLVVGLLSFLFFFSALADDQILKSAILTQNLATQSSQTKLLASARINDQRIQDLLLIGTVKVRSISGKDKVLHIVWTTIQAGPKTAILDHPLISVLKTRQKELPIGSTIPVKGKIEDILAALQRLQKNDSPQNLEPKIMHNPQSKDRHVLAPQTFAQKDASLENSTSSLSEGSQLHIDSINTHHAQITNQTSAGSLLQRSSHSSTQGGSELFSGFNGGGPALTAQRTNGADTSRDNQNNQGMQSNLSTPVLGNEGQLGMEPPVANSDTTLSSKMLSTTRSHLPLNRPESFGNSSYPSSFSDPQDAQIQGNSSILHGRNGRRSDLASSLQNQFPGSQDIQGVPGSQVRPSSRSQLVSNQWNLSKLPTQNVRNARSSSASSHEAQRQHDNSLGSGLPLGTFLSSSNEQRTDGTSNLSGSTLSISDDFAASTPDDQSLQRNSDDVGVSNSSLNPRNSLRAQGDSIGVPGNSFSQTTESDDLQNLEELTTIYEDCPPRIDEEQERVIHQQKTMIKKGNEIIRENQCQDTLTTFLIKRDYACQDCDDRIDYDRKQAFSRYRKYWVDNAGQRHALNDRLYVEENNPHPFLAERGQCTASINLDARKAHPQIQTVYYGRGNKRIIVENCHDDPQTQSLDIIKTPAQCTPTHDLQALISRINEREVFVMDGVEHEVKSCHENGDPIPHQFDASPPCRPIKNIAERSLIQTGKRYIQLSDGSRLDISSTCEPFGDKIGLHFSIEGCTGFQHDFVAGKSYPLGRWYYNLGYQKHFVTKCIPGSEAFDHHLEVVGYSHLDDKKFSYPQYKIWLETPEGNVIIKHQQTRSDRDKYLYVFDRQETLPDEKQKPRFEGCYKITPLAQLAIYRRQDGSEFKEFVRPAGENRSKDLCQRTLERRNIYEYTTDFFTNQGDHTNTTIHYHDNNNVQFAQNSNGFDVFGQMSDHAYIYKRTCIQVREKIRYPAGHESVSPWQVESVNGGYMPHCVIQGPAFYHCGRDFYPGAVSVGKNHQSGYSGRKPGPNRVN